MLKHGTIKVTMNKKAQTIILWKHGSIENGVGSGGSH